MYVGEVRRGIIILNGGLVLYIVMIIPVIMAFSIQGLLSTKVCFLLKLQVIFQAHAF